MPKKQIPEVEGAPISFATLKPLVVALISGLGYHGFMKILRDPKARDEFIRALSQKHERLKKENPTYRQQWSEKYGELKKDKPGEYSQQDAYGQPGAGQAGQKQKTEKEAFQHWVSTDFPGFVADVFSMNQLKSLKTARGFKSLLKEKK